MFAIGNDELKEAPKLEGTIICNHCGEEHIVKDSEPGTKADGTVAENSTTLQYYTCGGKTYLAGINGKDVRRR